MTSDFIQIDEYYPCELNIHYKSTKLCFFFIQFLYTDNIQKCHSKIIYLCNVLFV